MSDNKQRRFTGVVVDSVLSMDVLVKEEGKTTRLLEVLNEFEERLAALEERAAGEDTTRLERSERNDD